MPVLIDGYNLMHAAREWPQHRHMDREGLCRMVGKWARKEETHTTIIFDGVSPGLDVRQQMEAIGVEIRFSGTRTADDVIIEWIENTKAPGSYVIVSSDHAIQHAARYCRATGLDSESFMRNSIHPKKTPRDDPDQPVHEKPEELEDEEVQEWMDIFGNAPTDPTGDNLLETRHDDASDKGRTSDNNSNGKDKPRRDEQEWMDIFDPADLEFDIDDDLEDLI